MNPENTPSQEFDVRRLIQLASALIDSSDFSIYHNKAFVKFGNNYFVVQREFVKDIDDQYDMFYFITQFDISNGSTITIPLEEEFVGFIPIEYCSLDGNSYCVELYPSAYNQWYLESIISRSFNLTSLIDPNTINEPVDNDRLFLARLQGLLY